MKTKIIVAAGMVVALAGCASTSEIRANAPTATYTSSKPAIPVAKCILGKLEPLFKMASVQYRDRDTGASVWVEMSIYAGKDTAVMIDVDNNASGSATVFRSRLLAGEGKYREIIQMCQV